MPLLFLVFALGNTVLVNAQDADTTAVEVVVETKDSTYAFSDLDYVNGRYFFEGNPVSGRAQARYENKRTKAVALVQDGYLHGPAKLFYPNGQLYVNQSFSKGKLSNKFRVYYPNGEVLLSGFIKGLNPKGGGHILHEVMYGYYLPADDMYYLKGVRWKILEILVGDVGYAQFSNHIPFHLQEGFRLRDRSRNGRGIFIEDSRKMYFPDPDAIKKQKIPVKKGLRVIKDHNNF